MLGTGGRGGNSPVGCFLINKAHCLGTCACITLNAPCRCPCWAQGAERGAALWDAFLSTKRIAWVYVNVLP